MGEQKGQKKEKLFGKIALEEGFVTPDELDECIEIQEKLKEKRGKGPQLGKILIKKGYLSEEQADEIGKIQARRSKLDRIPGFRLQKKLGEGATGAVYKAWQISMDRPVAIKILSSDVKKDESYIERFFREARSVAKLNHEGIIKGIDVGEEEGIYYFVMEYVEGKTLREFLEEEEKLDEEKILDISLQMAKALKHAEKNNLVHRDIKPENIMINEEGIAKLCDLGLAKRAGGPKESSLTQTGTTMGTPYYMSPEQATGDSPVDIRTDLYSLGATMYHASTGQVPFDGPSPTAVITKHITEELTEPKEVNSTISRGLNAVLLKMMQKDPEDRYNSPVELIEDLENLKENKPPVHCRGGPLKSSRRSDRESKPKQDSRLAGEPVEKEKPTKQQKKLIFFGSAAAFLLIGTLSILFLVSSNGEENNKNNSGKDRKTVKKDDTNKNSGNSNKSKPDRDKKNKDNTSDKDQDPEKSRDQKAKEWYNTLEKEVSNFNGTPTEAHELTKHIDNFRIQFSDTEWSLQADKLRSQFIKNYADRHLKKTNERAQEYIDKKNLAKAYREFSRFPAFLQVEGVGETVKERKKELWNNLENQFEQDENQINKLLAEKKFEQAEKVAVRMDQYLHPEITPDLIRNWQNLNDRILQEKEDHRQKQVTDSKKVFRTFFPAFKHSVQFNILYPDRSPDGTVQHEDIDSPEKVITNHEERIPLKRYREKISAYRKDLLYLKSFEKNVISGIQRLLNKGTGRERAIKIGGLTGTIIDLKDGKIIIDVGMGSGAQQTRNLHSLSIPKRAKYATWYRGGKNQVPSSQHMECGLAYFYADTDKFPDSVPRLEEAKSHLKKAKNGGIERAQIYLNKIREITNNQTEEEVNKLVEDLDQKVKNKQFEEAKKIVGELEMYRGTRAYNRHQETIASAQKKIKKNLGSADAGKNGNDKKQTPVNNRIANLFKGKVHTASKQNGHLKVEYDFSSQDQVNDWRGASFRGNGNPRFSYVAGEKCVVGKRQNGLFLNKALFEGKASIELTLSTPTGINVGAIFISERLQGYSSVYNHTGRRPGGKKKGHAGKAFRLAKINFGNRKKPISWLDGNPGKNIKKQKQFKLRLTVRGKKVIAHLNGHKILERKDGTFRIGKLGAIVRNSTIKIHHAILEGQLSRRWLRNQLDNTNKMR